MLVSFTSCTCTPPFESPNIFLYTSDQIQELWPWFWSNPIWALLGQEVVWFVQKQLQVRVADSILSHITSNIRPPYSTASVMPYSIYDVRRHVVVFWAFEVFWKVVYLPETMRECCTADHILWALLDSWLLLLPSCIPYKSWGCQYALFKSFLCLIWSCLWGNEFQTKPPTWGPVHKTDWPFFLD